MNKDMNIIKFLQMVCRKPFFNSVIDYGCGGSPKCLPLDIPLKVGIEANPEKAIQASSKLPVYVKDLEALYHLDGDNIIKEYHFDLGLCIDVFEHFTPEFIGVSQEDCFITNSADTTIFFIPEGKIGYNPENDKGYDLHKTFWDEEALTNYFKFSCVFKWVDYHGNGKNAFLVFAGKQAHCLLNSAYILIGE